MTPIDQARKYIAAIPGAISGQAGHNQTYIVAVALTNGFTPAEIERFRRQMPANDPMAGVTIPKGEEADFLADARKLIREELWRGN